MKSKHLAVLGTVALTIALGAAQPASAQSFPGECAESGAGQITAASGDRANFAGSASNEGGVFVGRQLYVDHGPATPVRFRSVTVDAMICNLDAHTAEIIGQGTATDALGVDQLVGYRISVAAFRPVAQAGDRYRIELSNGYDSGDQPVDRGNINITER